ncbi:PP2C family protein-serine/threonine phosphatase [Listeria sp. ILCC797]|uniref:PP2C family protein-serine/threonine phosphatase n=1 Tax=Listeria sp. ILCC797 TaxID=1918333 RepID=UPI000B5900C2|nr:PP2C family protein-serine/threonine phosphatase [Listeria sp. ILCC797]
MNERFNEQYKEILFEYLQHQDEEILYSCEKLTKVAMENNIPPEEIINIHRSVLEEYDSNLPEHVRKSFDVLLEMMIGYGLAYLEHISLRTEQRALRSEIEQAETIQKTLMKTDLPCQEGMEFGVVSRSARQMSGDYYSFIRDELVPDKVSVALADVVGKGIPAAFSISMIKYALNNMVGEKFTPRTVLESLNEIAEENINDNMFITMFFGVYHADAHLFEYSSAGHELGLHYQAETATFSDLYAKGLPLGVDKQAQYREFEKEVAEEDVIFIMSDGVTEAKVGNDFIERDDLIKIFDTYIHLEPQKMVEAIYNHLLKMQNFLLHDDFTLIAIKRSNQV